MSAVSPTSFAVDHKIQAAFWESVDTEEAGEGD